MKRSLTTLVIAALAALAAAGCSSGTTSTSNNRASQSARATPTASASHAASTSPAADNGTAAMSAAQATGAAVSALTAAKSVRINGTFTDDQSQQSGQVDMWVTGTSGRGTMAMQGAKIETIFSAGAVYFKAGADALKVLTKGQGVPAGALDLMAGRWFKVGSPQESQAPVLTISAITSELSQRISDARATVRAGTLAGQPATIVSYHDGSKLYIAATGPARPLRLDTTGKDGGHIAFSGYGTPVTITPPPNALDMTQMGQ